ncbi:uncharacterized protein [Nicotiana sylvestris]|uniref:uncharacterized protein n=1 Tax=Nicotiana sylvestris TaxID=4096 RepID=UPI00388CC17F
MNVTMIYWFNDQALRNELWRDKRRITDQVREAWAIMGDFKSIVLSQEDRVGSKVTYVEIKEFKECVEYCRLQEMKSSGCFYTWSNKQEGQDRELNRIDRVFINNEWGNKLPAAEMERTHAFSSVYQ